MAVREIIRRALQMLRVVSPGETPSPDESADGLIAYNAMIAAYRGHGVGPALRPMLSSGGYARFGGLHTDTALATPLDPFDGCRFGVSGACTVTSDRTIEGGTVTVPTVWFFRADLDTWIVEADAANLDDETQFPAAFDDGFAALLALRLPDYGAEPSAALVVLADQAESRLLARYRPRINPGCDAGVLMMSRQPWRNDFR